MRWMPASAAGLQTSSARGYRHWESGFRCSALRICRELRMAKKYLIETFGCQMNFHDSERMAGLLEQAGYEPTMEETDADVIVINTCSVRERAEEKLFTRLGEIRQHERDHGTRPVVAVTGCVAQQEGPEILRRSSAVDVIIGTQNIRRLPVLVNDAL